MRTQKSQAFISMFNCIVFIKSSMRQEGCLMKHFLHVFWIHII